MTCTTGTTCQGVFTWDHIGTHTVTATLIQTSTHDVLESATTTVSMQWPSLTFGAAPQTLGVGQSTTLFADTSETITGSALSVVIENANTGKILTTCTTGAQCSVQVSHNTAQTQNYKAVLQLSPTAPALATTTVVPVTWQWPTVTMTAKPSTAQLGSPVILTATASQSLTDTGLTVSIKDVTTNKTIVSCTTLATCSSTITHFHAVEHTYQAVITKAGVTTPVALSNTSVVSWSAYPISLTANTTVTTPGTAVDLTTALETITAPPTQATWQLEDLTTQKLISTCGTTGCSNVAWTEPTATQQKVQAQLIYKGQLIGLSNVLTITWSPALTLTLTR